MDERLSLVDGTKKSNDQIRVVESANNRGTTIKVIGVGGAGGNAVDNMIDSSAGVEFITANTDTQALAATLAPTKVQIGAGLTRGLGAGADPEVGRRSAEESQVEFSYHLAGADMVFITAGMGGGTGTGAAPVIAEIARDLGCLTVAVVTRPFDFEGRRRQKQAEEGVRALRSSVDTLITVPNQRLLQVVSTGTTLRDAFRVADGVLVQAVEGIASLMVAPGLINLDFADVQTVMKGMGLAVMGTGVAHGDTRAIEAAHLAISSPLLEDSAIDGARGILLNVTGGRDMGLHEVEDAASIIRGAAHEDAQIIFGAVTDERLGEEIRVTVVATGFHHRAAEAMGPVAPGRGGQGPRDAELAAPEAGEGGKRAVDVPAFMRRKGR